MAIRRMPHQLAVMSLAATLALLLVAAAPSANKQTFHDPFGDVLCCTRDLTDVTVRNDDAGTITFDARFDDTVENGDDDDLSVYLDTDRNPSTGQHYSGIGIDYMIGAHVMPGRADAITLSTWDTDRYREIRTTGIHISVTERRIVISLDRHLIADTDGFAFRIELWEVTSLGGAHAEFAPDSGSWSFPVSITVGRLQPSLETRRPPRAGHRFIARLALRVARTHSLLASGRILCAASTGGHRLEALASTFAERRAVCIWDVPKGTRGKPLRGSIGVAVTAGFHVARQFAYDIK